MIEPFDDSDQSAAGFELAKWTSFLGYCRKPTAQLFFNTDDRKANNLVRDRFESRF